MLASAGSRYGPVSVLAGLDTALDRGEPFAIVAKPCDLNAVHGLFEVADGAARRLNVADESGRRLVRINAVGFPVYLQRPSARVYRFAALMRELAFRNDGTFVGLSEFQ